MAKLDLQDKTAIITGGASDIGTCISLAYAKAGANVVIASRSQENLDKVAAEISSLGRKSLAVATDICVPEQVDSMVKRTIDEFGRVDILVNNAGGVRTANPMEVLPLKDWNDTIALNLTGTFICSVAAGKVMIQQKSGRIINISSVAGTKAFPAMAHYGVAKAGVINLTESLAAGWAQHNINVNCIVPGFIATEGMRTLGMLPSETNEDGMPVPRLQYPPDPTHVADLAVFLASAAADRISGDIIPIRAVAI